MASADQEMADFVRHHRSQNVLLVQVLGSR